MIFAQTIKRFSGALLPVLLLFSLSAHAQDAVEKLFNAIADELPSLENKLVLNLNDRELATGSSELPRLGGFADLPPGAYPDSAEIEDWETAFRAGEIGGLIIHSDSRSPPVPEGHFLLDDRRLPDRFQEWTGNGERDRLFVTFASEDADLAVQIDEAALAGGYDAYTLVFDNGPVGEHVVAEIAPFYATAEYRLAIDTRQARRLRTDVTEMELLGERIRRDSDSVYRDPPNRDDRSLSRNEPRIFRKLTLGDEFNQPTIEEIVVPGGIALGESAGIDFTPVELVFDLDAALFSLHGLDPDAGEAVVRQLPEDDPAVLKSLFDLAVRSIRTRSDAVVDLDADRRVSISSALSDTDAGYAFLAADILPFEHLDYLPVTKSVIIDTDVFWRRSGAENSLLQEFETDFEVRFLSADRMRIAQTRLALEYEYDSVGAAVRYGGNWGRDASRLRESTDVDGLGAGLAELARYAGWVALFRRLEQDAVPFLKGRYDFMKIDKAGRETPRRFR